MISVDNALQIILDNIRISGLEKIDIVHSLDRVLGEDIYSDTDYPLWDNSAMDGYAVRWEDIKDVSNNKSIELRLVGEISAGKISNREVKKRECIKIMTGAPMPPKADTVVKVEDTTYNNGFVNILTGYKYGENVRKKGENIKKGDLLISKRRMITSADIGVMASIGKGFVYVYQRPRVAILSTGNELVDLDERVSNGKIYNSNSYSLSAQVEEAGGIPVLLGIARDTIKDLNEKISQGLSSDIILISGGVSVGDYDFVKDALKEAEIDMKFWKIAMRPGKPLAFGVIKGIPTFGLPGNPVSSMVSFEQFVRPSLLKMSGHTTISAHVIQAVLQEDIHDRIGRRHLIRGIVEMKAGEYIVKTTGDQGAANIMSMAISNGLILVPEEKKFIKKGEKVSVKLIRKELIFS
ncbi:MAG: gephyrin-like molybdotransferase Glp [Nitrospirota bacterium]